MVTDDLLIDYLLGEADATGRERIERWLAADERNRERFQQFSAIWDHSDRVVPPAPSWQEAYARFRQRLEQEAQTAVGQRVEGRRMAGRTFYRLSGRWQLAAVLTGFLFLAGVLYVLQNKPGSHAGAVTVSRPGAVTLPDGSVVKLDSNTTITYASGRQPADRIVYLQGQAFFSVAADPSRPFVVHVRDLTIHVLGTSFTVRQAGDSTLVEMATGAVEVRKGRARRVIRAGDVLWAYGDSDELSVSAARVEAAPVNPATSDAHRAIRPSAGKPVSRADSVRRLDDHRETVRSIIRDLVKEKIVPRKEDVVWFGLDNAQFVVNDRRMPDSLLIKFRSKYIRPDGMGYYYGSVKITGQGYFFTKQELNEH